MATPTSDRDISILVINPNTSTHMTDALKALVERLGYAGVRFGVFTAPASESTTLPDGRVIPGVPSIDSREDAFKSALHCRPFVEAMIPNYDAFLVACYSAHPLVGMLKEAISKLDVEDETPDRQSQGNRRRKYVTGIFEASVTMSLTLTSCFGVLDPDPERFKWQQTGDAFGIVSTGKVWEEELSLAVASLLAGPGVQARHLCLFAGVETTGLTAVELHSTPAEEVTRRMVDATVRLLTRAKRSVGAICLGCAGMAGLGEAVRTGCIQAYGETRGQAVRIVDGVVAGVGMLVTACRADF